MVPAMSAIVFVEPLPGQDGHMMGSGRESRWQEELSNPPAFYCRYTYKC